MYRAALAIFEMLTFCAPQSGFGLYWIAMVLPACSGTVRDSRGRTSGASLIGALAFRSRNIPGHNSQSSLAQSLDSSHP